MRKPVKMLSAFLVLAACCPQPRSSLASPTSKAPSIQHLGVAYRQLTGDDLRRSILGATRTSLDVFVSGDNNWYYDGDGHTFWNHGHRGVPNNGTYEVTHDWVCHSLSSSQWCDAIYKSADGKFVSINAWPINATFARTPERITLTPGTPDY